ncbi:MAG: SH3 domain-containing protein [Ignavibacteria bacterium]
MKSIINLLLLIAVFCFVSSDLVSQVKVKGYYKKDGTYVQPHYRSNPDGNPYNNWSYPGNTNPYTGKTATGNENTYLKNYYEKNNSNTSNYYSNSSYNSSYYTFDGTGSIIIFTDYGDEGNIMIFVDDNYAGTLDKYFSSGNPTDYGEDATVCLKVKGGYHKIEALGSNGSYWSNDMPVYGDINNLIRLTK